MCMTRCMMCKDAESTELVRIVSKDSIINATKLLAGTTLLQMPGSSSEVGINWSLCFCYVIVKH